MSSAAPIGENRENEKPPTTADPEQARTWKERWVPRLKLMAALALPVYLETLDYTGTLSSFFKEAICVSRHRSSRRDRTNRNREYVRQTRYTVVYRHV